MGSHSHRFQPGASGPDPGRERAPIITRHALLDRLGAERVAVVEAAAGYGKTTLALQWRGRFAGASVLVPASGAGTSTGTFVAALRRAIRAASLSDLVGQIDPAAPADSVDRLLDALAGVRDPVLLIFDDVHELGADAIALTLAIAAALPSPHRLLVSGRQVGFASPIATRICSADLAFTPDTNGQSGPSNIYELDITYVPAGTTTTFPIANPPAGAGPTLRLSYQDNSDYMDWGYAASPAAGQPAGVPAQGTVTMAADAKSGQFSLKLPFTGDDNHTVAAGSKPDAMITGAWKCTS